MFSGYGGAEFALKKVGVPHKCIGYSEIKKHAIKCFDNNHPGIKNYGDCTQIEVSKLPDFDLLTGGFPCQPFSEAGKHKGELDIRGTLFADIVRIAEVKQPRWMLLENVKGLIFENHKDTFNKILSELDRVGYKVYWKLVNSKDYGTPQSRERVIFVCFRKDIDKGFEFPEEEELRIFLRDLVEKEVPEKYLLGDGKFKGFEKDSYPTGNPGDIVSVAIRNKNRSKHQQLGLPYGTFPRHYHLRFNRDIGVSYAIKSATHEFMISDLNLEKIRSLTPKESFRLMGFFEDEINLDGLSESQKYDLAGNGWDVNLVSKIFKKMFSS
ncbi:MAG: DNA (cytosine-5-)-methyltransferase [Nanoarchaeota archaeon]|nr:DNA (cytosine-5-)-methyltransferase [Nanoarchaeota archaeon]